MSEKSLKIGSTLMAVMGVFALVIAILWILITEIMFVSDFLFFTGESYQEYLAASPAYAEFYIITKKLVGFMILAVSIPILFINQSGYKNGEKWSWYALFITGGLLWGTLLGYRIFIGYVGGSSITFVVGLALWLLALLIPIKNFFGKEAS
ncbi:MAG: hypothetical protein EAX87_11160 [Candidatus Thorarchaeota archaeon]|nr:hypothetical protein [Candidatus Thorarchaeota archaeon]